MEFIGKIIELHGEPYVVDFKFVRNLDTIEDLIILYLLKQVI